MTPLQDSIGKCRKFEEFSHADNLRLLAWLLHEEGKEHLRAADFAGLYDGFHLRAPVNLHRALQALEEQGDLMKSSAGYRLSKSARDRHTAKYGDRPITVGVLDLLASLPLKLSLPAQQEYLDEALRCFRASAWRAAAIMSWNLAFDHLCQTILKKVESFNIEYAKAYAKRREIIARRADLQDLKESEVIRIARASGVTDGTQHKSLERNLGIRNDVAHPSGAPFTQPQAEAFILDVIQTVVLGLSV
jgi:hypothetical protein